MARPIALIAVLLFVPALARADSVWTYQGNSIDYFQGVNPGPIGPNPCNCALTGSVTLDASGTPLSWSFTAASTTWNIGDSRFTAFYDHLADQSAIHALER
jgi:hypothetical protein